MRLGDEGGRVEQRGRKCVETLGILDSCFIQVPYLKKTRWVEDGAESCLTLWQKTGKTKILQKVQWINLTQGWKEDGIWQGEGGKRGKMLSLSE